MKPLCTVCGGEAKFKLLKNRRLLADFCSRACLLKWLLESNNLPIKWPAKEEKQ